MKTFELDGEAVEFSEGQTLLEAALAARMYIPTICYHKDFEPHGSCRVCVVWCNGRAVPSCTTPAREGDVVRSNAPEVIDARRGVVQLLFTEGNHFCPSCEASGRCTLQAVAYELEMTTAHHSPRYPDRPVDASHPDFILDFNRCILCELCVRASARVDRKGVFHLSERGIEKHLVVSAESGRLADTDFSIDDAAASVCPVGVILRKRQGFDVPIGARRYDARPIREVALDATPGAQDE